MEAFVRPRADHIIGIQIDVGKDSKVAKLEATLDVEASGAFSDRAFPDLPTSRAKIGEDSFGAWTMTSENLENCKR